MTKDPMGDRFKRYEAVTQQHLPRRTYTIMRLDGRAFHTLLRGADKPFDVDVANAMNKATEFLCNEVAGTVFGYTQSDEISLLLQDFDSINTEPWFGGNVQKMVSVAAGMAARAFNLYFAGAFGVFDCRVFTISDPVEVANYFIWRQRDCVRNSISMLGQAHFSPKQLHGLTGDQIQELLFAEKQINYNDQPVRFKRGAAVIKESYEVTIASGYSPDVSRVTYSPQQRTRWTTEPAPHFTCEPDGFLAYHIPELPNL